MNLETKALLFDVFGTVVDWRSPVLAELRGFFGPRGISRDWERFILDWRGLYQPAMAAVREGRRDYVALDLLHRENLLELLDRYDVPGLTEAEVWHLTTAWHRLNPWADSVEGLRQLRAQGIVAALSNGNIALMVNLARHAGLVWDAILGAEIAQAYKPDPRVYLRAAEALGLEPDHCMMVAAHNDDLRAARELGLRTAFVLRATEYGPGQTTDLGAEEDWDVVAESLTGVADVLNGSV